MELFFKIMDDFISPLFYNILYLSIIGTLIGLCILFFRRILDRKISPRWKCIVWGILLISVIIPIQISLETKNINILSVSGIIEPIQNVSYISEYKKMKEELKTQTNKIELINSQENYKNIQQLTKSMNKIYYRSILFDYILPLIWICGSAIILSILILSNINLHKIIKNNTYINKNLKEILQYCKKYLGVKQDIKIILQDLKRTPCIIGIINPKILITKEFLKQNNETIKYIIMHELSHYKRKDLVFNYILILILLIHWFNPFIWLFFKKIRQDIELATDEMVISTFQKEQKKQYALTLINSLNTFKEEKYTSRILCVTDDIKNMERRIKMIKLSEKFNKNKVGISIISICIIIVIGTIFFIHNNNNETISNLGKTQNKINYEYKLFKPTFKTSENSQYDDYDFTQDMTYQQNENIYYRKIDNYKDYIVVKNRWNDILDMNENDFKDNFMVISAIENTSMIGLTVDEIENDNNYLYISLIKDERFKAQEDIKQYKQNYNEYENTCISYILPKTMEKKNIVVTRNLRNDEKNYYTQMQLAEHTQNDYEANYSFEYKDKKYNQLSSTMKPIEQDWKDMIYNNFVITKDMPNIDFSNWKALGDGFYSLQVTKYSEYRKLMNNYNIKKLNWWDFKNIYAIIIVRDNSNNRIHIDNIEKAEKGKSELTIEPGAMLDVTQNFRYPGMVIFVPNYRNLEENYLEVRLK